MSADREIRHRRRHHADQAVAGGWHGGAGTPVRSPHRRSAPAVEAEPDGYRVLSALLRLFAGARSDVQGDQFKARTLARYPFRRSTAHAAELHRSYIGLDPVQT